MNKRTKLTIVVSVIVVIAVAATLFFAMPDDYGYSVEKVSTERPVVEIDGVSVKLFKQFTDPAQALQGYKEARKHYVREICFVSLFQGFLPDIERVTSLSDANWKDFFANVKAYEGSEADRETLAFFDTYENTAANNAVIEYLNTHEKPDLSVLVAMLPSDNPFNGQPDAGL